MVMQSLWEFLKVNIESFALRLQKLVNLTRQFSCEVSVVC